MLRKPPRSRKLAIYCDVGQRDILSRGNCKKSRRLHERILRPLERAGSERVQISSNRERSEERNQDFNVRIRWKKKTKANGRWSKVRYSQRRCKCRCEREGERENITSPDQHESHPPPPTKDARGRRSTSGFINIDP